MRRRKSRTTPMLPFLLFLLLILVGLAILWIGVPILAQDSFGSPAQNLTAMQRWTYSLQLLLHEKQLTQPASNSQEEISYTVPSGASVSAIGIGLENSGLIRNWQAFRYFVVYKGLDTSLKAGDFTLSPSMTTLEIVNAIQSTYTAEVTFYIYPGWRVEEIAAALPTSGIEVSPEDFLAVAQNPGSLNLPDYLQGAATLEGFLFPGTYTINRKISASDLALTFVQRFDQQVTAEIRSELQSHGLSVYQSIVLASIIQRETFDDSERAMIASVFYNRLADGMKLETDPTVQYALGYSDDWGGWWKSPLSLSDLDVQSPFNTYQINGLPEHPISNPDLASILAVARPDTSAYYYFRAKCDGSGSHVFSQTYEEHLQNACQ